MASTYRLGWFRRLVNRVIAALLPLGVGPGSTYLLTTTGRLSGQPRTTPVTLVENGAERWLVAPYGAVAWVHNVRATPQVTLRRGRTTLVLAASELLAAPAAPVLRRYVAQVPVTRSFFHAGPNDPVEQFEQEAAQHPVFALTDPDS